jgi:DNA-binding MarR family transcriptional regulator
MIVARNTTSEALHDPSMSPRLPELVDRTTIAVESLRTQWRTVHQLGTHERMTISQLRIYGSMPMSELAARIALSRAAVTSLVDRLEGDGWVRRVADVHDRRRTVLQLQPQAAEQFDSVTADYRNDLRDLESTMDEEEQRVVREFLQRLGTIADRHADGLRASAAERSLT